MKYGYMAIVVTTTCIALTLAILSQKAGNHGWAFSYTTLTMLGSTFTYLLGWKYSGKDD